MEFDNESALTRAKQAIAQLRVYLDPDLKEQADDGGFLPNFCNGLTLLNVIVISQMLAFVVTLVTRRISSNMFEDLLLISIFIQWIALSSAAVMCALRTYLNRLPDQRAFVMAYLLLLCVTWLVSEAAVWLLWLFGKTPVPHPEWYAYFHIQNLSVAAIVIALALRYLMARQQLRRRTLSEARAKMQALRARLRPHFLFNSMNIIASLTRSAPTKAEAAIEDMADLFRMMLSDDENLVPIKNEVALAKKYLNLEALRLDSRLNVDWDIGTFPRRAVMPILTLQPLLENSIQHGIEPLPAGGSISVRLREESDNIEIRVANPLPSSSAHKPKKSGGSTLDDIRQRLTSHYGDSAKLEVIKGEGRFTVTVTLPMRGGSP
jgi:two-component system sensor histidine kinase AlgZ